MEDLRLNIRLALRTLRRNPLISFLAVLCLALGIGANTAIFSVVNTVLLRPLPFRDVDRLTMLTTTYTEPGEKPERLAVSPMDYQAWNEQSRAFESITTQEVTSFNLLSDGEPERIEGAWIAANWLQTMGVEPVLGRGIQPDEDRLGTRGDVVLLGHGLWRRRFGSDPAVLGRKLVLDGQPFTVIGVLPQDFQFPYQAELWAPMGLDPNQMPQRTRRSIGVFARLEPDASEEQAQTELSAIAQRLELESPGTHTGWGADVRLMRDELTGDIRPRLYVLITAVAFVLLIACANVASLLLARAHGQGREVAIQTAIGADRRRLIRQFLTESLILSLLGGALGVLFAYWTLGPMVALSPVTTMAAFFQDIDVDGAVLAFAVLVSVLTGVVFGLAPALKASRPDLQSLLKEGGGKTSMGAGGRKLLDALVVLEVAVAVVLLVGAGLMQKSFSRLSDIDPGIDRPEDLLTFRLTLPPAKYPEGHQREAFVRKVLAQVRTLPGVASADVTTNLPVDNRSTMVAFIAEGRPVEREGEVLIAHNRLISAGYLGTMGIDLVQGRDFTELDGAGGPPVVIVSRELARRYLPGRNPIGQRVKRAAKDQEYPWLTVVGVADDVKDTTLEGAVDATWYLPYAQQSATPFALNLRLALRSDSPSPALAEQVIGAIRSVERQLPVYAVATMEEQIEKALGQRRFGAVLFGIFAVLGLVLAAVGLYGVMSYSVNQRVREIGVRMALGAHSADVLRLVVLRGLALTLFGLTLGLAGALALTRLLGGLLYEVEPDDPVTFVTIAVVLTAVAFLASYLPARRATRVDPVVALRFG